MADNKKSLIEKQFNKSKEKIFNTAFNKLTSKTDITNLTPGGLARSILDIFTDEFDIAYDKLTTAMVTGLISKTPGPYLDEVGKLVDCERRPNESHENYRYRITKQNENLATANRTALRLACLSVDGVEDIEFKDYLRGIGTFDVYVITEDPEPSPGILQKVQEQINKVEAEGNDGAVLSPRIIPIDMNISLIFYENTTSEEKRDIRQEVTYRIEKYINNQKMGGEIIIKQLITEIMNSDNQYNNNKLKNAQINSIYINNELIYIKDMDFYWDERPVIKNLVIS